MASVTSSWLRSVVAGAAVVLVLVAGLESAAELRERTPAQDLALAREYVFAACLIEKYRGSPLAAEAEVWAQGLVERGAIPAESYAGLAQIARNDAPQPLQSKNGTAMLMQSCMQLYNSAALSSKITKLLRARP